MARKGNRVDGELRNALVAGAKYFVVFFAVLLCYQLIQSELVTHTPFVFDPLNNLGVPAFAGVVGFVTKMFGGSRYRGGMR